MKNQNNKKEAQKIMLKMAMRSDQGCYDGCLVHIAEWDAEALAASDQPEARKLIQLGNIKQLYDWWEDIMAEHDLLNETKGHMLKRLNPHA